MAEEKKPAAKRLAGLNTGPGASRLGNLRSGDGAGPSSAPAASAATGGGAAGGSRKMRFMPTNFSRPKQRADSTSEGAPSTSVSVASKSESAFEDLMKAAKADATWQRRGAGRGAAGRGNGRALTTFGGGAGAVPGGSGPSGGRRMWGGNAGAAAAGASAAGGPKRLVKAGDKLKQEDGTVKAEPGTEEAGGKLDDDMEAIAEEYEEYEEDPISYDQYYPAMLPHRQQGEPLLADPDDPAKCIPQDLFDLKEDYRPMLEELSFLHDIERNDGRLMLFQLPSLLPIAASSAAVAAAAAAAAGGADGLPAGASLPSSGRPAQLKDVPSSKIGKLLVFESGKVKLQIGDVLLDVDPGIPPRFRQDVAVVSAQSRQCVMLAPISLRMVCTPNLHSLLDPDQPLPQWPRGAAAGAAAAEAATAAAAGGSSRRAVVLGDESSSGEEAEGMGVDAAAAAAVAAATVAAYGGGGEQQQQQQPQQQLGQPVQQQQQQQQQLTARLAGVAVKEEDVDEVQSPRRGGLRSPRGGRRATGGGGNT